MLVTVVMPAYNSARYIRQAIQGVLNQRFAEFELLIVDDASRDDTLRAVKAFSDPRIKVVANARNLGIYRNFNKCLALASGKYVFMNHTDDVMMPDLLEKTLAVCESDPGVSCCGANALAIDASGGELGPYFTYTDADILFTREAFLDSYFARYSMAISSVLIRKDVITRGRLKFDPKEGASADMVFWIRLALCSERLFFLHAPLLRRRIHEAQCSALLARADAAPDDFILKTQSAVCLALAASNLRQDKKRIYINSCLKNVSSLLLPLPAQKRHALARKLRDKLAPPLRRQGLRLAETALQVYAA